MTKARKKRVEKKQYTYAIYKGDEFIDVGTKEYIMEVFGITYNTLKSYSAPSYLKRIENNDRGNRLRVVKIDESEIEE